MLQRLQQYKWYILIGILVIIIVLLMYQSYTANKKINMLYRCINELSCRLEDVIDSIPSTASKPHSQQQLMEQSKPKKTIQKPIKQVIQKQVVSKNNQSPQPSLQKVHHSPQIKIPQPVVSETIIFQVAPKQQTTATTIEEIESDSDSDVEVEETKMKDIELDKALEAELSELNE